MLTNTKSAELSNASPKLDFIWIELTNRCNLSCKHCYSNSGPDVDVSLELTYTNHRNILLQAAKLDCKSVQFIGGEPTLYPHLIDLIMYSKELGFNDIEVFTNLLTLKDDLLELVERGVIRIATSFYSSDQRIHGEITESLNSFKHTVKNISRIVDVNGEIRACVPLMKRNLNDQENTFEYLSNLGVEQVQADNVREFGRASKFKKDCMKELCGSCAGNVVCVSPEGLVSPCIMSKKWSLGDLKTNDLAEILALHETNRIRSDIQEAVNSEREKNGVSCLPVTCLPQGPDCLPKLCLPRSPGIE